MDLTPELLLSAYMQGIFPMAHEDGRVYRRAEGDDRP